MFTEYSRMDEVKVLFTLVKDKNGNILFQQKESRLPVYRFWQRNKNLGHAASLAYVKAYLNYNHYLKSVISKQKDLLFIVVKSTNLSDAAKAEPLLLVSANEI